VQVRLETIQPRTGILKVAWVGSLAPEGQL
jgi:hypothetical protein